MDATSPQKAIVMAQHTLLSSAINAALDPVLHRLSANCTFKNCHGHRNETKRLNSMPLHTYSYACGCRRYIQGRECDCFLKELLSINSPAAFSGPQANYLPFNMENSYPRLNSSSPSKPRGSSSSSPHHLLNSSSSSRPFGSSSSSPHLHHSYSTNAYSSCRRHDRKYRSKYDCPDHVYRRQKSLYESHWEAQRLREYESRKRSGNAGREWTGYSFGLSR
jgi:hypothetical protein